MTKPLFKKPKKQRPNQRKIIRIDEEEDGDHHHDHIHNHDAISTTNDNGTIIPDANLSSMDVTNTKSSPQHESALDKIRSIKKNQKLKSFVRKHQLQTKKANNKNNNNHDKEEEEMDSILQEANKDLKERLDGNFASTNKKHYRNKDDHDDNSDDEDGGILRKKHKLAMENYIHNQMTGDYQAMENNHNHNDHNGLDKDDGSSTVQNKKDLFVQLLKASEASITSANSHNNVTASGTNKNQEGDVGAGGAVLGGTGIAEVILSVDDRLKNIKETEMAIAKKKQEREARLAFYGRSGGSGVIDNSKRNGVKNIGTSSSAVARTKDGAMTPADDMSNLGSSYSHNFRLHNSEWIENKKIQERTRYSNESNNDNIAKESNSIQEDKERIGFHAKRGLVADRNGKGKGNNNMIQRDGLGGRGGGYDKSNDDHVYKNFVSRNIHKR